jgi:hypothetical protein
VHIRIPIATHRAAVTVLGLWLTDRAVYGKTHSIKFTSIGLALCGVLSLTAAITAGCTRAVGFVGSYAVTCGIVFDGHRVEYFVCVFCPIIIACGFVLVLGTRVVYKLRQLVQYSEVEKLRTLIMR